MPATNLGALALLDRNTGARAGHVDKEVHTVNTNTGVVLNPEINVLLDTKTKVTSAGEVALAQLVLLDLQALLQNLLSLLTAHGGVNGDLLVTTNGE